MASIGHAVRAAFESGGAAVIDELGSGISHGTAYPSEVGYYVRSGIEHNDGNRVTGFQALEDRYGCWTARTDLPAVVEALRRVTV